MSPARALAATDMARRLAEAEATIAALLSGQIDAVVDPRSKTPVLLARAQESLRESEERLRHERDRAQGYLDTAEVILLKLDINGRIALINRYACSILGAPAEELLGRDWIDTCLPPRIRDGIRKKFTRLLEGDLSIFENPILSRSGEEHLIEWRNRLLLDDEGHVVGTFSSGTDITERTQAVDALRDAEERTRFALEAAGVGIWDIDYTTGTIRWSKILEAQYGLKPGTFGGTFDAFLGRIHPDDRDSVMKTIAQAATSGADFTVRHRSTWPDGTVRWLNGAGRILLGAHGEPLRGVGISQDVTERRTLEDQYQQAQKMEAVGQLASGVAHDFNNLLTVILGFGEIINADAALGDQHKKDLAEILDAAGRASGLTKQLLAFSRQQVLTIAPLDANGLINDMTGMLGRLIGEHIEVALVLAPDLPLVLADRGQLEQVVMNLVVNARDAMPNGGHLTIETTGVDLERASFDDEATVPGHYVMLAVVDTGSGMNQETLQHLFEPFFTTKAAGKGTGLGLSTTYGIVKQSKGYISVSSEVGRGTTFKVYLPRASADVSAQALSAAAKPIQGGPLPRGTETVMVVEDESAVRELARGVLEGQGYEVLSAANGRDGLHAAREHQGSPIRLVITDVIMPLMGGKVMAEWLKTTHPDLKILFTSGYTDDTILQHGVLDPGVAFLPKPYTPATLTRKVREMLDEDTK